MKGNTPGYPILIFGAHKFVGLFGAVGMRAEVALVLSLSTLFVALAWGVVGLALFAGWLWYGIRQAERVECDACFTFNGRTECRVGRGDSEASAITSANTAACAALGSGVSDAMQCGATPPTSARCKALGN